MKRILLAIVLLISTLGYSQMADYELQELKIDVAWPVIDCEITLIVDDVYYPVKEHQIDGSIITLYLAQEQTYLIILDCYEYLNITLNSRDVIDERDLHVSASVDYQFEKGILVFNY
tara:strand:+ start:8017 stop:8367 length:351 start_codon:yes stop_codon:yes gene_type:complete